MSTRTTTADPTTAFAKAAAAGKVVVNRWVRMACERHLRDLKDGAKRGLRFDREAANHAIDFFDWLKLPEGDKPFTLAPFQRFKTGCLFGWKGADGFRRFRTAYIETAKGNGKSPWAAGIGLYGLAADSELSAEILFAATAREQANIPFGDFKKMAEASPALLPRLEINAHSVSHPESGSLGKAVSSEHRGLDGRRVHFAIIDEIHEHPNSLVVDKIRAGTKGRKQALIIEITNSGFDRTSVCWLHHEYSLRVLQGTQPDDSWFAYVCGLDPCEACLRDGKFEPAEDCTDCDNFADPTCWPKANPNLGVSVTHKYLSEQAREAIGMPSKANIVKRLNFCIWTSSHSTWIPDETWAANAEPIDPRSLEGQPCTLGIDLAFRSDYASVVALFKRGEGFYLLPHFWLPEEGDRDQRSEPTAGFIRQKLIELTPGPSTEFEAIRKHINEMGKKYQIKKIGVDPWNCRQLSSQLIGDGFEVVDVNQNLRTLSEPTKEFERLAKAGLMKHDGNAVMRWQISNVSIAHDASGNARPAKDKSKDKIDGPCAALSALAMYLEPSKPESVYERRGVLTLDYPTSSEPTGNTPPVRNWNGDGPTTYWIGD